LSDFSDRKKIITKLLGKHPTYFWVYFELGSENKNSQLKKHKYFFCFVFIFLSLLFSCLPISFVSIIICLVIVVFVCVVVFGVGQVGVGSEFSGLVVSIPVRHDGSNVDLLPVAVQAGQVTAAGGSLGSSCKGGSSAGGK
jgi:hypothetical protein